MKPILEVKFDPPLEFGKEDDLTRAQILDLPRDEKPIYGIYHVTDDWWMVDQQGIVFQFDNIRVAMAQLKKENDVCCREIPLEVRAY